ncbi:MAG TPA: FHIPEP family type III secretion protein [Oscillatoriaceae cyanobacterium]
MEAQRTLATLMSRYGQERGLYLYGEFCLLQTVGLDAFRSRHTGAQLQVIETQLREIGLWPEQPTLEQPADALMMVAHSLRTQPFYLRMGLDLFNGCMAWAAANPSTEGDPAQWFEPSRTALYEMLGFWVPKLQLMLDPSQPLNTYRLYVGGELVEEGTAYPGLDLVVALPQDTPPPMPYPWTPDPAGPGWVAWMPIGPAAQPPELPRVHWITAIARHVTARLPAHAYRLLTVPMIYALLTEAEAGGYDHEIERYVSLPELRLVFQALLRQGLPLRPIHKILDAMLTAILAELAGRPLKAPELERLSRQLPVFSTQRLLGFVRAALGLPEDAAAPYRPDVPPAPKPERPEVSEDDRRLWAELLAIAKREAHAVRLLHRVTTTSVRGGEPPAPAVMRAMVMHMRLSELLVRIERYLARPRTVLEAAALSALRAPDWPTYRWTLAQPRRLVESWGMAELLGPVEGAS